MNAFIITPLDSGGRRVSDCVARALSEAGIDARRPHTMFVEGTITESILDYIRKSDLIFCDISRQNPHVFYELGFAHAMRKEVVLLRSTDAEARVPVDLQGFLYMVYEPGNLRSLQQQVTTLAANVLTRKAGSDA